MTCLFKGPCLPMEDGMEQPGTTRRINAYDNSINSLMLMKIPRKKMLTSNTPCFFSYIFFSLSPTPYVVCLSGSRVFDGDGKLPHPLYPKCLFWCTCAYGFETRGQHQDETESRDIAQYTLSTEQKLPHLFYQRNGFYF